MSKFIVSKAKNMEKEIKNDIENVLRQMCFGHAYREYDDNVIDKIYNTAVIRDKCIRRGIVVDEDVVVTALMEIVCEDY